MLFQQIVILISYKGYISLYHIYWWGELPYRGRRTVRVYSEFWIWTAVYLTHFITRILNYASLLQFSSPNVSIHWQEWNGLNSNLGIPWTVFFPSAFNSLQIEKYLITALQVREWVREENIPSSKIWDNEWVGKCHSEEAHLKKKAAQCQRQDPPRRRSSNEESRSEMSDWQAWWDVQVPRFGSINTIVLTVIMYYIKLLKKESTVSAS